MARTVADAALLLAVLAGPDPRVPLALDQPPPAVTDPAQIRALLSRDLRGIRVAWSPDLGLPVEPEVLEVLAPARQVLAELTGVRHRRGAGPVRRGRGVPHVPRVPVRDLLRRAAGASTRTWSAPTCAGTSSAASSSRVADLSRATMLRTALAERVSEFFAGVDVLACPVSQVAPFDVTLDWVHEINGQPQQTYLDWMASAYLISMTGLPAISVPAGFTPGGLPVGLQLVGRRRGDWDLLAVAHAFEAATGHAAITPDLACRAPLGGPARR